MTLKQKAVLAIVSIVLVVIGMNTLVLVRLAGDKYIRVISDKSAAVGEGLAVKLSDMTSNGIPIASITGIGQQFQDIVKKDDTIQNIFITDTTGAIVFHNDPSKRGGQIK